jgi:hypothetical protein
MRPIGGNTRHVCIREWFPPFCKTTSNSETEQTEVLDGSVS